ncbi:MAG: sialate O-acetylesterase, partial [Pirellulales bacterium]|nr:sialate O-acetylesterase [Pirellulales bacterium]
MNSLKSFLTLVLLSLLSTSAVLAEPPEFEASKSKEKIKVFILAGQSNMEGRGFPEPLTWQVGQEEYRERYTHFIQDGNYDQFIKTVNETKDPNDRRKTPTYLWSERKDVWINYLGKHGNLKVGYGAPNEGFGPEFNFGHVVGNHYDEQVLIIKTSWGGRALAQGFMPPSSMPSAAEFEVLTTEENAKNTEWNANQKERITKNNLKIMEENKTAEKKKPLQKFKPRPMVSVEEYQQRYGIDYRNMVSEVHECLANLKERFPGYQGQGYEIEGFVWFQGWNDQYNDRWLSYES